MSHICDICNYETNDLSNFSRHKLSQKHIKKIEHNASKSASKSAKISQQKSIIADELKTKSDTESDDGKTPFSCRFCHKFFKHNQSLWKHEKYRCRDKSDLEDKINELNDKISQITNEKEKILNIATTNAKVAKKSMSAMSFALKHYENAPPIGLLEDDEFDEMSNLLMYDSSGRRKTEKSIEEVIIFHHKQCTLSKILGDLIVKVYKKSNPRKQSAWSSDITRLTFIIKDIVGKNKKSKWVVDKKGIHFSETIINPLLNKISEMLIRCNDKCGARVRNITNKYNLQNEEENEIKNKLSIMQEINSTLITIKLGKIHMDILKYVAPYFNLNFSNVDDLLSDTSLESNSDSD